MCEALVEAVAETSEEFMDRYFGGEEFSDDEIRAALRANVLEGSIVPVLMGSNILARGMYTLMADIVKYLPSPEKRSCTGINTKTNEVYNADYDFAKSKSAYVFKSIVDPYIGKYSLIKVNSGVLKTDDVLYNYHRDCDEKIGKLYVMRGSKVEEVKELHAVISERLQSLQRLLRQIRFPPEICLLHILEQVYQSRMWQCATRQRKRAMRTRFPSLYRNC